MPFKDPEKKKEWSKRWRKAPIANGYGKWLYQRRALRYADADYFREALVAIEKRGDRGKGLSCADIAREALAVSADRWENLGPPPETHVGEKEKPVRADTLLEAIAKLGLE